MSSTLLLKSRLHFNDIIANLFSKITQEKIIG